MTKLTILFSFLLVLLSSFAQKSKPSIYTDTLNIIGNALINSNDNEYINRLNAQFAHLLDSAIVNSDCINSHFDSVPLLTCLSSKNKKVQLFVWSIKQANYTYSYHGFLVNHTGSKKDIYPLHDTSGTQKNDETKALLPEQWHGAHYYKLIEMKHKGQTYFTLLGWDGNNATSNQKIIDVLWFNDEQPTFGSPLFYLKEKAPLMYRVIFTYSKKSTFTLRYEKQPIEGNKKRRNVILFDRLIPINDNLKGQYEFYVPATNLIDAFYFTKGTWTLLRDIDARNPKQKAKHKKIKPNS